VSVSHAAGRTPPIHRQPENQISDALDQMLRYRALPFTPGLHRLHLVPPAGASRSCDTRDQERAARNELRSDAHSMRTLEKCVSRYSNHGAKRKANLDGLTTRDRVAHSNCWVASIQPQKIFHGFDFTSMKLAQMDGHAQPWTGLGMVPNLLCTLMAEAGIALRAMERVDVLVSVFAIYRVRKMTTIAYDNLFMLACQ
jgi:hypothetical protein